MASTARMVTIDWIGRGALAEDQSEAAGYQAIGRRATAPGFGLGRC
ncbi:MAG TPA: hypothetical protein VIL44_06985 [Micromonospora sp.]